MVVVFNASATGNDINWSVSEDGLITISPWELLVAKVHVGEDGLGGRGVLYSGKAIGDSKSNNGNSSNGDLGPLVDLLVELCC